MAHILAVDDEPNVRLLMETILRTAGHRVRTAADGAEALEMVKEQIPDLIVLDLAMPGMDGWRFLEELYARGLRRRTRVVIVSGNVDDRPLATEDRRAALAKPFEPEVLLEMVRSALEEEPDEAFERRERSTELARLLKKMDQVLG